MFSDNLLQYYFLLAIAAVLLASSLAGQLAAAAAAAACSSIRAVSFPKGAGEPALRPSNLYPIDDFGVVVFTTETPPWVGFVLRGRRGKVPGLSKYFEEKKTSARESYWPG